MTENNSCPPPVDVQDFLFKQASIGRICDGFAHIPNSSNLIAADTKRGLLYIGHENKLLVVKPGNDSNPEWKIELDLPDKVCRVQISCDCSFLAVTFRRPSALIYDASSINKHRLDILHEIRLSSSAGDIVVSDLKWNPAIPELLCSITSDHTIGCFQISRDKKVGMQIVGMERIQGIEALCVSWSPKGKQLVVGCKNGDIIQLKPELKPARHLTGPKPSEGVIISILWISNYQFCACYYLSDEQRVSVMIVDAPKGVNAPKFTNYEDVTYGTGSYDNLYYYFEHIPEWGLIIAASSHSTEVAVLGSNDNGSTWTIWQMVEGGAVQLPLNRKQGLENYPIGITIDRSPTQRLPWTADSTLPNPVPILRILVTSGQLCNYHMVNLREKAPDICSPPSEIIPAPAIPRTSIGPEVSFNLPSGATSTPRTNKTSLEAQLEKPKISNMFGDAATPSFSLLAPSNKASELPLQTEIANVGFSAPPEIKTGGLFTPASVKTNLFQQDNNAPPINPQFKQTLIPQQPAAQLEVKSTGFAARPEMPKVQVTQPEIKIAKEPIKEQPPPSAYRLEEPKPAAKESPVYDDALCLRAYFDEQYKFEKELQSKLELPNWQCGTDAQRDLLVKKTEEIDEFLRELKDTTNSLASDIAYLKALLLQSFAWLEESKSKNATASTGGRARAEGTKLADLKRLYYYTQSQLVQATKVLDLEWAEHKNRELTRMKIPNLEFIYQSLVRHSQIIAQEKKNIEELSKKCRCLARGGSSSLASLDRSMASLNLSQSSNTALVSDTAIDLRCKLIATNTRNFSREKQTKLRDLLAETAPMIVRAVRPSAVQDRLEATLSALAAQKPIEATSSRTRTPKSAPTEQQKIAAQQKTPDSLKSKTHNPLSSLDNLVSGIGSGMSSLSSLSKSPSSAMPFSALTVKSQPLLTPTQSKAKENMSSLFTQSPQQALQSAAINKPFAKMDTISFGTTMQKTPEPQASKDSLNKTPENENKFSMFPANTFGRLGSPEALSGAAAGASSMTTLPTVPKSTFSFSSTTAPPTSPQSFAPPKLDNTTVFKFSSNPSPTSAQQLPFVAGPLDMSSLNLGNRSGLTITPVSDAKAAATSTEPAALPSFAFGRVSSSPLLQQSSIFGQSSTVPGSLPPAMPPLFGKSVTPMVSIAAAPSPQKSSAEVKLTAAITTAQPTITTSAPSVAPVPSSPAPILSAPPSSSSAFGTSSLLGGLAVSASTFNFTPASTQAASSTAPTAATTTAASSSGISFGNLTSTMPSSAPGFAGMLGATSAVNFGTSTTGTSITPAFGTATTRAVDILGSTTAAATTASAAASPATSITSIFGKSNGTTAASSTVANIFGGATTAAPTATTAASSTSLFGSTSTTGTTSIFGGQTTAVNSSSNSAENSFFSPKPAATTTATAATPTISVFGGGSTSTSGASFFGGSNTAAPVFGATTATTQANNIFGESTGTQSSTSIFGSSNAVPTSGTIFGGASSTPAFATATTTAASTAPSAGIFGSAPATGSIFGGGTSAATPATASSVFGGTPTASVFGGGAAAATTTPSTSIFGTPAVTTAGASSMFGAVAASPQAVTGNMFGAAATSPSAAGASSIFGGPPAFGAGAPTFGSAASPAAGIGTPPAFGGSAFGGAPGFGGKPIFGSPGGNPTFGSGFGSPPSFGGALSPGFGSAPVFGSTSPTAASTSPSKIFGSNTFEELGAQQGGLSFGSLAQSTDAQKPAFGGSTSFSSWR